MELDRIDRKILAELQKNSARSVVEIAEAVSLSANPVWRRIKRLEADGVILGRVALLDRDRLGLGVTAFVSVKAACHSEQWLRSFAEAVSCIPDVVELYRLSGEYDYLLKVIASDVQHYDRVYKRLIKSTDLMSVTTSFAMEEMKHTTALPLFSS